MSNPPPTLPGQQDSAYVAPTGEASPAQPSQGWTGCAIGCMVVFGLCCLLCAGAGVWVYMNFSSWATTAARSALESVLDESELPLEERTGILDQFDRLATAYQEGEISMEELGEAMQDLAESPIVAMLLIRAAEVKYLDASGLSDEEQETARRTIARVTRGMIEERFSDDEIEQLTQQFVEGDATQPGQPQQLKPTLTDEELRTLIQDAKELADSKQIPDEDYDVSPTEVVRNIVDEALAQ